MIENIIDYNVFQFLSGIVYALIWLVIFLIGFGLSRLWINRYKIKNKFKKWGKYVR